MTGNFASKNKGKYQRRLAIRLAAAVMIGVSLIRMAAAFFGDIETARTNKFLVGQLDLILDKNDLGQIELGDDIGLAVMKGLDSLDFKYKFIVETDGSDYCRQLVLTAIKGEQMDSGWLPNFVSTATAITIEPDQLLVSVTDPINSPAGQACQFSLIFLAWQINRSDYEPRFGFSDVDIITARVESGSGSGGAPCIQVIVPNGGEIWWVGRTHEIRWETMEPEGLDQDLLIDIYYSNDSGNSWGLAQTGVINTGLYLWRVPLFLENNTYWVPSDRARIKLSAHYGDGRICGIDTSDEDYCPPIEYELLTAEELAWLEAHGLLDERDPMPMEPAAEEPIPAPAGAVDSGAADNLNQLELELDKEPKPVQAAPDEINNSDDPDYGARLLEQGIYGILDGSDNSAIASELDLSKTEEQELAPAEPAGDGENNEETVITGNNEPATLPAEETMPVGEKIIDSEILDKTEPELDQTESPPAIRQV